MSMRRKSGRIGKKWTVGARVGIAVGVLVGLFILRAVLKKKQAQEIKLRGYTLEERAGMDGTSDDI